MISDSEKLRRVSNGLAALMKRLEQVDGCVAGAKCIFMGGDSVSPPTGRNEPTCGCITDVNKMRIYALYVDTYLRGVSHLLWDDA